MKEQFIQKVDSVIDRPESKIEKVFGDLRERYFGQIVMMNQVGLIELLPDTGEIGYVDFEGVERPIPDYEELVAYLDKKAPEIKAQLDRGFTQLRLVPIGASVEELIDLFESKMIELARDKKLFSSRTDARGNVGRDLITMSMSSDSDGVEIEEDFLLKVKLEDELLTTLKYGCDDKMTKKDYLESLQLRFSGWQVCLFEDAEQRMRHQLDGIDSDCDDLIELLGGAIGERNRDIPAVVERGLTLESWLLHAVGTMQETSVLLGSSEQDYLSIINTAYTSTYDDNCIIAGLRADWADSSFQFLEQRVSWNTGHVPSAIEL